MGLLQVVELPQGPPECSWEREMSVSLGSWCAAGYSAPICPLCQSSEALLCFAFPQSLKWGNETGHVSQRVRVGSDGGCEAKFINSWKSAGSFRWILWFAMEPGGLQPCAGIIFMLQTGNVGASVTIPTLIHPGFRNLRLRCEALWHAATQHVRQVCIYIVYAEHIHQFLQPEVKL